MMARGHGANQSTSRPSRNIPYSPEHSRLQHNPSITIERRKIHRRLILRQFLIEYTHFARPPAPGGLMAALDLRPLSLGELLDRTFFLYRQHFLLFIGIAAMPYLILLIPILVGLLLFGLPGRSQA